MQGGCIFSYIFINPPLFLKNNRPEVGLFPQNFFLVEEKNIHSIWNLPREAGCENAQEYRKASRKKEQDAQEPEEILLAKWLAEDPAILEEIDTSFNRMLRSETYHKFQTLNACSPSWKGPFDKHETCHRKDKTNDMHDPGSLLHENPQEKCKSRIGVGDRKYK